MIETVLTGGGAGGLIIAVAYAWQQIQASRREKRSEPRNRTHSAITDAEAVNRLLLAGLSEEREEVQRLSGRVMDLETQNALLYERIRDQRRDYEKEIAELRRQLGVVSDRLNEFQERLRNELPPEDVGS